MSDGFKGGCLSALLMILAIPLGLLLTLYEKVTGRKILK